MNVHLCGMSYHHVVIFYFLFFKHTAIWLQRERRSGPCQVYFIEDRDLWWISEDKWQVRGTRWLVRVGRAIRWVCNLMQVFSPSSIGACGCGTLQKGCVGRLRDHEGRGWQGCNWVVAGVHMYIRGSCSMPVETMYSCIYAWCVLVWGLWQRLQYGSCVGFVWFGG